MKTAFSLFILAALVVACGPVADGNDVSGDAADSFISDSSSDADSSDTEPVLGVIRSASGSWTAEAPPVVKSIPDKPEVVESTKCGESVVCTDYNDCTFDFCDPTKGCVSIPEAKACDDGNACTIGDACSLDATCVGTELDCNDGDPCTADSCFPDTGCNHKPICEETPPDLCEGVNCDDGNPCTDDACDPTTGVCLFAQNNSPCDDGDGCTNQDQCSEGSCSGIFSEQCECDYFYGLLYVGNTDVVGLKYGFLVINQAPGQKAEVAVQTLTDEEWKTQPKKVNNIVGSLWLNGGATDINAHVHVSLKSYIQLPSTVQDCKEVAICVASCPSYKTNPNLPTPWKVYEPTEQTPGGGKVCTCRPIPSFEMDGPNSYELSDPAYINPFKKSSWVSYEEIKKVDPLF